MRIRGRKPTVQQRKVLQNAGVENTKDWLYIGISHIDPDGYKSPAKSAQIEQVMRFQNRITGEIKDVQI